jgi:hypothetical protein
MLSNQKKDRHLAMTEATLNEWIVAFTEAIRSHGEMADALLELW